MVPRLNIRNFTNIFHGGHFQQKRNISLVDKLVIRSPKSEQLANDLAAAITLVHKYDPVGYLPGLLLATNTGKIGYFSSKKNSLFYSMWSTRLSS